MVRDVERHLRRTCVLRPGVPVWVAVSGGVDSMVLLHVLRALGHPCSVAHVDHGLRGSESDGDLAFVRDQAAALGLPFRSVRVDTLVRADAQGISVEMAARELRYAWFGELLQEGSPVMALGQHQDDAVETLLLHLLRGTGIRGWEGMPSVRTALHGEGRYIRPLATVGRDRIQAYATEHGIPFRTDSSNTSPDHLRNRIRMEVSPLLETLRPGAGKAIARSASLLRELTVVARGTLHRRVAALEERDGLLHVPFAELEQPGGRLLLMEILQGEVPHPDVVEDVLDAVERRATGATFLLRTRRLTVDRGSVVIDTPSPAAAPFRIDPFAEAGGAEGFTWSVVPPDAVRIEEGPHVAWLDLDNLGVPLELRPWMPGDRMRPIGLSGSRAISDLLIDAKVPRPVKASTYVLVSGEVVVWLVGHRVAEGYQAVAGTKQVLRIAHHRG